MLEAAREQRADGVDVVVGYVETHGRRETEALARGARAPAAARPIEYRGVDARASSTSTRALARRPALLLVDELAHTNAPGSRHAKRWQDVEELLDAGIDVYTTLNVQHVESLNDVVAQITGVVVRETVPDSVLERADEIELVDLPPDDLLQRLREGKVYLPEQAERALRELLPQGQPDRAARAGAAPHRRARRRADARLSRASTGSRDVAGARAHPGRASARARCRTRLVRAAGGMADGSRAEWIVGLRRDARPSCACRRTTRERRRPDAAAGRAARRRDAIRLSGPSVERGRSLAYARERNVTQDRGRQAATRPRWRASSSARSWTTLVRGSGDIDVLRHRHRATRTSAPASRRRRAARGPPAIGVRAGGRVVVAAAPTARGVRLFPYFELAESSSWCTCSACVVVAARFGRGPAILAVGPERRRVRLLLRAAPAHLRGLRRAVPRHVRRHAGRRRS